LLQILITFLLFYYISESQLDCVDLCHCGLYSFELLRIMFKLIQDRFQACKNKFAALEDILPESPPSSAYHRCTSGLSKGLWDLNSASVQLVQLIGSLPSRIKTNRRSDRVILRNRANSNAIIFRNSSKDRILVVSIS
jgi:hypothetical protein